MQLIEIQETAVKLDTHIESVSRLARAISLVQNPLFPSQSRPLKHEPLVLLRTDI